MQLLQLAKHFPMNRYICLPIYLFISISLRSLVNGVGEQSVKQDLVEGKFLWDPHVGFTEEYWERGGKRV